MKDLRTVTALLVLICIFVTLCNADDESSRQKRPDNRTLKKTMKKGARSGATSDPKVCPFLGMPGDCCKMAMIIPKEKFQGCMVMPSGMKYPPGAGPSGFGARFAGTGKQSAGPAPVAAAKGNPGKGARSGGVRPAAAGGPPMSMKGPGPCAFECAMKKLDLINAEGKIIKDTARGSFVANVEDIFKIPVGAAFDLCYPLYEASNFTIMTGSPVPNCKVSTGQFMLCMRKELEMNCVAKPQMTDDAAREARCAKRMAKLTTCDPYGPPAAGPDAETMMQMFRTFQNKAQHSGKGAKKIVKKLPRNKPTTTTAAPDS